MKHIIVLIAISIYLISCNSKKPNLKEFEKLISQGSSKLEYGKDYQAIKIFNKAEKISSSYELYFKRGKAYFNSRQLDKAIIDFNKAIKINKNAYEPYFELHFTYWHLKNHKKELEYLDKAQMICKQNNQSINEYHRRRGQTLVDLKEYKKALSEYNTELKLYKNQNQIPSYIIGEKGIILYHLKNYKEAFELISLAVKMDGDNFDSNFLKYLELSKKELETNN